MKAPRMDRDAQSATTWPPARLADAVVTGRTMHAADPDGDRRHEEEQHPPDEPGYGHGV